MSLLHVKFRCKFCIPQLKNLVATFMTHEAQCDLIILIGRRIIHVDGCQAIELRVILLESV